MNALRLREFDGTDRDYAAVIAVDQEVWPEEPVSEEGLRHDDTLWDAAHFFRRIMLELDSEIAGYAEYSETPWAYEPDKYFITIKVRPAFQNHGFGSTTYDHIARELISRGARIFSATVREDQPHAVRFVLRRGFQQVIRELESRLDVESFDRARFEPELRAVRAGGIAIRSIRDLQKSEPEWLQKWYDVRWKVIPDMPTSEEFTQESLEEFAKSLESPHINLDAAFVAIDMHTGEWVGISSVAVYPEEPETMYVGNTGVIRSHRRRHIGLALKVHTIEWARDQGAEEIVGENEENNPMYELNRKLGFEYSRAWLGFEKHLS